MKRETLADYKRRRALGWRAAQAIADARTLEVFVELGGHVCDDTPERCYACNTGAQVRLRCIPDETPYDDSYIDTWGLSDWTTRNEKMRLWDKIESVGVWGVVAEVWTVGGWEHADSVWGFVGTDWLDSGYDTDLMASAIRARTLEPV